MKNWQKSSPKVIDEDLVLELIKLNEELDALDVKNNAQTTHAMGKESLKVPAIHQKKFKRVYEIYEQIGDVSGKVEQIRKIFAQDSFINLFTSDFLLNNPKINEQITEYKKNIISYNLNPKKSQNLYQDLLHKKNLILIGVLTTPGSSGFIPQIMKLQQENYTTQKQVSDIVGLIMKHALILKHMGENNIAHNNAEEIKKIFEMFEKYPDLVIEYNDSHLIIDINFVTNHEKILHDFFAKQEKYNPSEIKKIDAEYSDALKDVSDLNIEMLAKLNIKPVRRGSSGKKIAENKLPLMAARHSYVQKYDTHLNKMNELWSCCCKDLKNMFANSLLPQELNDLAKNLSAMLIMLKHYKENFKEIPRKEKDMLKIVNAEKALDNVVTYLEAKIKFINDKIKDDHNKQSEHHIDGNNI